MFSRVTSKQDFGLKLHPLMLLGSQKQNEFPSFHGVMTAKPAGVGGFTRSPRDLADKFVWI